MIKKLVLELLLAFVSNSSNPRADMQCTRISKPDAAETRLACAYMQDDAIISVVVTVTPRAHP